MLFTIQSAAKQVRHVNLILMALPLDQKGERLMYMPERGHEEPVSLPLGEDGATFVAQQVVVEPGKGSIFKQTLRFSQDLLEQYTVTRHTASVVKIVISAAVEDTDVVFVGNLLVLIEWPQISSDVSARASIVV